MSLLFIVPLLPVSPGSMTFYRLVWPLTMMASVVLQYLAWGMPGPLKRYLNRNYHAPAGLQGMTEEELLRAMEEQESPPPGAAK